MKSISEQLAGLPQFEGVRVYETKDPDDRWLQYQENEKAHWLHRLNVDKFDPDPWESYRAAYDAWNLKLGSFKGKNILDIGAGPFGFCTTLALHAADQLPKETVLLDPLMRFYRGLGLPKDMPGNCHYVESLGERTPFLDNSFDVIISTNTIDHVQDYNSLLCEIRRLLKPDGRFFFFVHVLEGWATPFKKAIKIADKNHPHHFTARELGTILVANGFQTELATSRLMNKWELFAESDDLRRKILKNIAYLSIKIHFVVARLM